MRNEEIEYLILNNSNAKTIMTKLNVGLADVKFNALQLKREGVLDDKAASKYFQAVEDAKPRKVRQKKESVKKDKTETESLFDAEPETAKGRRKRVKKEV